MNSGSRRPVRFLSVLAGAVALIAGFGATPVGAAGAGAEHLPSCGAVAAGSARCHAILAKSAGGPLFVGASPAGYNPPDLQSAYALPSATNGVGQTVAIVDAYNDPNAESDLGVYRSQFGLSSCTTSGGCFKKVNQSGGIRYPRADGGWAQEISLDLDMVSAICPNCHILLVEASSNSFANLAAAVNYAASVTGVVAISNSYGASEFSSEGTAT